MNKIETLIVGAGVVGSSVAMHLAKKGMGPIRVIDFDLEGTLSSSELNAGGVRATWNQQINIEMAKMSIQYFSEVADEVGYKACGYLWLHTPERIDSAVTSIQRQKQNGWPVDVWDLPQLKRKVPFLDKTDGIGGAIFAARDGLINPNLLKNHFRSEARKLGVIFDDRTLLHSVEFSGNSAYRIQVVAERFESVMSHETKLEIAADQKREGRSRVQYQTQRIINCAGPWANHVAQIIGYKTPCYPVRRQVCIFDSRELDLTPYGMIVDTSGVYFHPEATNGLAGIATPGEVHGVNFHYDGESFFNDQIWPSLYERSTHFERLKHITGWAGLYEVSPDETAILGQVDYGGVKESQGVFEAHSFSGHGVMHSYATGLGLAERVLTGKFQTLEEMKILVGSRFDHGKQVHENWII